MPEIGIGIPIATPILIFRLVPTLQRGNAVWSLQRPSSLIGSRFHDAGASALAPPLEPGSQRVCFVGIAQCSTCFVVPSIDRGYGVVPNRPYQDAGKRRYDPIGLGLKQIGGDSDICDRTDAAREDEG